MNRDTRFWLVVMLLGLSALVWRAAFTSPGMGREYVRVVTAPEGQSTVTAASFGDFQREATANPAQTEVRLSVPRTIGLWMAAFFTLAVFSFMFSDNPAYKVAEAVLVGVSAAYWMVVAFWEVLVPNLLAKLAPDLVQNWAMPGRSGPEAARDLGYLVPLVLGIMLLWRLMPRGAWIARWPLAFVVGTTAGLRLIAFLHGDFLAQIRNSIVPLVVFTGDTFDPWLSVRNIITVVGMLCCIAYFFFSFEHKGLVGRAARVGIWILMITFGASFGYTVMGRIALLAIRIEFLLDNWLWLIDPTRTRTVAMALLGWFW